jgi:hypothetical protein
MQARAFCIAAIRRSVAVLFSMAALLSGCAGALETPLPPSSQAEDRAGYSAQQARARQEMDALNAKKASHTDEALRQIQKDSR